ncbi:MAG: LppX_LprAFG lipoprotein [Austwickia sp.]|nr:MAG: LppX_LprAFG lipoprotein [Austwickia sp.]
MTVRRGLAALTLVPLALAGCSSGTGSGSATGASAATSSSSAAKTAYELCDKPGDLDKEAFLATNKEPSKGTAHIDGTMDIAGMSGSEKSATSAPSATGSTAAGSAGATGATGTATTGSGTAGSSTGMPIVGDVDGRDPANPKVKLTMGGSGAGGQIDMIMVDKVMYMSMGQLTGGKYVKLTMDDIAKQSGVDVNQLTDPTAQLARAKDAIVKVSCVGREDVAGTKTAHLKVTMDSAKVMDAAKGTATSGTGTSGSGAASSSPATLPSGVPATMDTEMWVGADNRPVKVASGTDQAKMTMTYSKWGEPVTITAPPAASVTTMPGMPGGPDSGSYTSSASPSS